MGLTWLITGGAGFIGRNLVDRLISDANATTIIVYDDLSVGQLEDLQGITSVEPWSKFPLDEVSSTCRVYLAQGDIKDANRVNAVVAAAKPDIIVHLAANTGVGPSVENPRLDMETNIAGTFNFLEAARQHKVGKFIFASSGAPAGEIEPPIHEEIAPHPVSPYGASKLAGEGYCSAYFRTFGANTIALRFGNVYGPRSGHKSSVVAKFINLAMRGETLSVYGTGEQTRDFIYIDDLIAAILKAANVENIGGEVFQIATNHESSVRELLEKLLPVLESAGLGLIQVKYTEPRQGDVMRNFSDTSKAKKLLDWEATTTLEKGLKQTVDWFVKHHTR